MMTPKKQFKAISSAALIAMIFAQPLALAYDNQPVQATYHVEGTGQFNGGSGLSGGGEVRFDAAGQYGRLVLSGGAHGGSATDGVVRPLFTLRALPGPGILEKQPIPVGIDLTLQPRYFKGGIVVGLGDGKKDAGSGKTVLAGSLGIQGGIFEPLIHLAPETPKSNAASTALAVGFTGEIEGLINQWIAIGGALDVHGLFANSATGLFFSPEAFAKTYLGSQVYLKTGVKADVWHFPGASELSGGGVTLTAGVGAAF
ncbi:hypothetical protein WDW37_03225 [Bdellovibrionota bacterium FG-1]